MVALDFTKLPVDRRTTVWIGLTAPGAGIPDVDEIDPAVLNSRSTTGMIPASQSISWNDWGFGVEASETLNEPSLADSGSYEEFGQSNYGGEISWYLPREYDDNSNLHSEIYDITDKPSSLNDIAVRIDGDLLTTDPVEPGDFVSAYRVSGGGEANPFTPGESKRRTVSYRNKGDFSHFIVAGEKTITIIPPAAFATGDRGRIRASQEGRDVTAYLDVRTSDGNVIQVEKGGFFEVVGAGTATVTFTDPGTGDSEEIVITA